MVDGVETDREGMSQGSITSFLVQVPSVPEEPEEMEAVPSVPTPLPESTQGGDDRPVGRGIKRLASQTDLPDHWNLHADSDMSEEEELIEVDEGNDPRSSQHEYQMQLHLLRSD